jgi:catechol 2,3-dioxygenase-like lactoylglutathione lyase family enzyme
LILGVHHPALSVPDLEEALEFYCGKLGFECVMNAELPSGITMFNDAFDLPDAGCKVAMIKRGNSCIEIFEFQATGTREEGPERPVNEHGITHICLASDDYQADYERLAEAGVRFNTSPVGGAPGRWAYGRDPFGNVLELLEHDPDSPTSLRFDP